MERREQYVLKTVEERGIRFIRLWFTDILGSLKSFAITPAELESAFSEGLHFDGSAIDGFSRVQEADMLAVPDATTFQILPWRGEDSGVARMFCDIVMPDGSPFEGDPRYVLRRNLERAAELGYSFYVGPEVEYFYFRDASPDPEVLDRGGYFDLTPLDVAQEYRRNTIMVLEQLGIPVEFSHHEVSPSQHELDLRYTDALTMADNLMTTRLAVKEVAMEHGIYATFMPKPLQDHDGSGLHLHVSLFRGDDNAFAGENGDLSAEGRSFMAGLLNHAGDITAVTNQWVNSYKRLVSGFEAPVNVTWGRNNQSALVRVPTPKQGKDSSVRLEYRSPDPACNPYLALSAILAAGLDGIERGLEAPAETPANSHKLTREQLQTAGIARLPANLDQALDLMEGSKLVSSALGEHVFEWFLRNKRAEWDRYQHHVSRFELEEYLPVL
ncbi:MAG: type I glutamate--ammonia ligase [Acidimicrobiia bacterium]|nr:type I glutamate--ammonia ligase [Acidimicrobiia bacterium]MBT8214417.1 type I glutamate--ammonia ligase [Acidimicrobiia bacterium]NNK91613.1 type I glutamate--ammonia ligase [Acidimicrobiia bacterium]